MPDRGCGAHSLRTWFPISASEAEAFRYRLKNAVHVGCHGSATFRIPHSLSVIYRLLAIGYWLLAMRFAQALWSLQARGLTYNFYKRRTDPFGS